MRGLVTSQHEKVGILCMRERGPVPLKNNIAFVVLFSVYFYFPKMSAVKLQLPVLLSGFMFYLKN